MQFWILVCIWEKNTRFFHRVIARRKLRNQILGLKIDNVLTSNPQVIHNHFFHHFSMLLGNVARERVFSLGNLKLNYLEDDAKLNSIKPFSTAEIEKALRNTDSAKAPGPDGLSAGVLKAMWPTIKDDVIALFENFFHTSEIPKGCNASFIALVPKVHNPQSARDFRPISLINSSIKLLSKALAARLGEHMNSLISDTQSAFIKGRQISDGIIIVNEVYEALNTGNSKGLIFDSINWDFMFEVMEKMNFHSKWIDWIKAICYSARISVLVNGTPTKEFFPRKGLRQGDPLSPLLFNLAGEIFSSMIQEANKNYIFDGIQLPSSGTFLTHLQYADDVILFIKNDDKSISGIKRVLNCFELLSGLKINFHKSSLYGFDEDMERIHLWASQLGCFVGSKDLKYLGSVIGPSPGRLEYWKPLCHKFHSKLQNWDAGSISMAGRLVLIRYVLDILPSYWLNLFKIPSIRENSQTISLGA